MFRRIIDQVHNAWASLVHSTVCKQRGRSKMLKLGFRSTITLATLAVPWAAILNFFFKLCHFLASLLSKRLMFPYTFPRNANAVQGEFSKFQKFKICSFQLDNWESTNYLDWNIDVEGNTSCNRENSFLKKWLNVEMDGIAYFDLFRVAGNVISSKWSNKFVK